jgi:hypothetical protein
MDYRRPFKSELVLEERISESTLKAYHVGFDQNKFRLTELVDIIRRVIPEFALGYYCGENIPLNEMIDVLKEAAQTVYTTDKYQLRGEFGELILHLLLRDFHNTIPLISKIYFKDSENVTVHGFDGVQITIEGDIKKLWLGESKLYKAGVDGVKDLANDVKNHVQSDYLRKEFQLISRKLPQNVPEIEHWRILMDKHQKLETIYSSIVIPLVCTYTSDIFIKHNNETDDYVKDFISECKNLKEVFDTKCIKTNVEIILMLLPIPCKDELNKELDIRLKAIQRI